MAFVIRNDDENINSESTIDASELDVPDVGTAIIAEIGLPDIETIDVGGVEEAQIEGYLDVTDREGLRSEFGSAPMELIHRVAAGSPWLLNHGSGEGLELSPSEPSVRYLFLKYSNSSKGVENLIEELQGIAKQQRLSEGVCDGKVRLSRNYRDSACNIGTYRIWSKDGVLRANLQSVARYLSDYISSFKI